MKQERVLITGIAGFIGSNLSRALLDRGYRVDGIDNLSSGNEDYIDPRVDKYWEKDISLGLSIPIGSRYRTIVHLASKKIPRDGGGQSVLSQNTRAMQAVYVSALKVGARIIFASTSDVYGKQSEFHEGADHILGPTDISRWTYALSKLWQEQYLYAQTEVDFNIVRYFGSHGPYMSLTWTGGPTSVFIGQALKGEPLTVHGDGKQTRCFSYVDDIVDGTILLMESDFHREVFNLGNPDEEISMYDFAIKVFKCAIQYSPLPIPAVPLINMVPYSKFKYEDVMRRVPNINKAQSFLGYYPKVGLDEGLRRTIEWQRKETGL